MKKIVLISMICLVVTGRIAFADDSWTRGIIAQSNDIVVAEMISSHIQDDPGPTRTSAGMDTLQLRVIEVLKGSAKPMSLIKVFYNIGWADLSKKTLEPSLCIVGNKYVVFLKTAASVDGKLHYLGPSYTLLDDNFGSQPYRASLARLVNDEVERAKIEELHPTGPVGPVR